VRIRGKRRFRTGAIALVNGQEVTTQLQAGELLAFVPNAVLANTGNVSIAVKSGTMMTPSISLQVVPQGNISISAIRPQIIIADAVGGDFGVEIQGNNFTGKTVVRVGGVKVDTEVRRRGELGFVIGTVAAREVAMAGSVPIQLENADGSPSNTFNIQIVPPGPNLNQIDPASADIGDPTTKITLTGTNFSATSKVFVNGQLIDSVLRRPRDDTKIDAMLPAELLTSVSQLRVKVVNEGVGDSDTLLFDVTPKDRSPLLFSTAPTSIVAGSRDTEIVILGSNLQNIDRVMLNGTRVPTGQVNEVSRRALTVTVRARDLQNPGQLMFQVMTRGGSSNILPIRLESPASVVTVAGGQPGFLDGVGARALFANPSQAVFGPDGMVYIADQANNVIRRLNLNTSEVVTIAGDPKGQPGYVETADIDRNNPTVRFSNPIGLVFDNQGILYISDFGNNVIRRLRFDVTRTDGIIVDTIAGRNRMTRDEDGDRERVGEFGFFNDRADLARFSGPYGMIFDSQGNLLVADSANNVIRRVFFENGQATRVETFLGNGFPGLSDGPGNSVQFRTPLNMFLKAGKLIISDFGNNSLRMLDLNQLDDPLNQVQTVVGLRRRIQSDVLAQLNTTRFGFGDGNRFFAVLNGPISAVMDEQGNIFTIDFDRNRVRRVTPEGDVTTILGGSDGGFTDGAAPRAEIRQARQLFFVGNNLFMVDSGNNRIRRIDLPN
jgi:sugar lactone lactonase YvrE